MRIARRPLAACIVLTAACTSTPGTTARSRPRLATPPAAPYLTFVDLSSSDAFKHVVLGPLSDPSGSAFVTPLVCGACIRRSRAGLADATPTIFGPAVGGLVRQQVRQRHRFPLTAAQPGPRLTGRPLGRHDALRKRALIRRARVFDEDQRVRSPVEYGRHRRAGDAHRDARWGGLQGAGFQLLGRHLRARRRHVLRDALQRRPQLPDQGQRHREDGDSRP